MNDNPPSYDLATGNNTKPQQDVKKPQEPPKQPPVMQAPSYAIAGPSYTTHPPNGPPPTVYHYTNPVTGDHIASLLPPDHPEMICLQSGKHVRETSFGVLGILAAVFWFPLGVGLCLLDRRVKCRRCGQVITDGLCG
ncbi:hypothetical protein V5O48_000728 [Marasmius crinis-equi]|uniref:Brain protein I3 n=1 Tax=Marasmius crinis-equi TaxID=585013 RepID=A0ABR3G1N2_9AGAR